MKRYVYINDSNLSADLYCDNRISNRKYTIFNFLPKNLWEQFSRFMNQYFLLIACLQLWSLITPVNPASTWGPLIFIFAVSASKEAWDDYNRYLSDKQANEKEVWVVKQGIKKHIQAQDISVGNIVWLRENDEVPCDLVLIGTSEPQGVCFVETAALDGETDLKTRVIPSACVGIPSELLHKIKGVIECPNPDKDIRRFVANLRLFPPFIDNDLCPLTINNTLLQSCYLRNTDWACGIAIYTGFFLNPRFQYEEGFVYSDNIRSGVTKVIERLAPNVTFAIEATREIAQFRGKIGRFGDLTAQTAVGIMNPGNETKLGMSRGIPEPKLTAVDAMIDKLTGAIFLFQIVVVIVLGIAGNVWKDTEARNQWYVLYPEEGPWYELLVIPLRFELLCSIMIPISIKVSLDLVKSLYAKFIDWDEEMYDLETNTPAHAANTAISEDLGQVEYILTDKTGTLTENRMIFRRCCINGIYYGNESGDALKDAELLNAIGSNHVDVIRFLTVMALCNTVVPLKSKSGAVSYKAQSQDEEALVTAAASLHMVLINKNGNMLQINFNYCLWQYEILDILEFTSDRKRMSVVIKDCQNGKIILLSKGADEAILPFACSGQQIRSFVDAVEQYSQLGLRTLCLAWRELKEEEFREWSSKFKEANTSLVDREWKLAEVCQLLEHDLEVLGVTAIEDRLQDGVPETIDTLRKSGINFWMLTGDKQNTAIQIALSCNFISPEPKGQLLLINGKSEDEVSRSLERVLLTMRITASEHKDVAFVVDGWALEIVLKHHREAFTELAELSRTAVCCRVTPSQKAQLVEILKSCDYRTLAIGDGGNDVRMIQQADIGVGISGREGQQAARAADYSIGKFRFLKRLILVHGRYSYNRTAFLSQYSFYKSLLICFIQIFFSFISGVSGTSLFNSVSLMAYNVFYTSIPVLMSVFDKDLSEKTVLQHPQILFYCQAGRLLNPSTFAGWFGRSLFHAIVVFIITIHAYADEKSEMEELSMVALSGCIWLQVFVVMLETKESSRKKASLTDPISLENIDLTAEWVLKAEEDDVPLLDVEEVEDRMDIAAIHDDEGEGADVAASKRKFEFSTEGCSKYFILGAFPSGILLSGSFTLLHHLAIWGNLAAFYVINCIVSTIPSAGMYTIMFRLSRQPSYWITMFVIVAAGMGPVLALKYFRYTYRSSAINILQQAERSRGPNLYMGSMESPLKEVAPLSITTQPKTGNPVYEPLLSDSPSTTRRSSAAPFDFLQHSQSGRLSSTYSRNIKTN